MMRVVMMLAALVLVAGCGSDNEGPPGAATGRTAESGFPATVEHAFGTTTVPKEPERIVVVGLTEQDIVLELGHTPVATTEWYGEQPYAVWPWAKDKLGDAKPTVLHTTDGFEFEKIASLAPDLIIGVNAGMEKADYDKFSALAPTIAGPKGGTKYFSPWDQQVELVAAALGKPDEGRELVERIEADYAKAAAAHPEFKGKTATFAQNAFSDGVLYTYQPGLGTDFLEMLGFTINPKLTPLVKKTGEQVAVSAERLDVIDADVIVFATEKPSDVAGLKKVPTFDKLDAVAKHRSVYTDGTLAGALYFLTPLSLSYALEKLMPQLAAAVKGEAPQKVIE